MLSSNGVGTGNGGNITITTARSGSTFFAGAGVFANGINGTVETRGGASGGRGGYITIQTYGQAAISVLNYSAFDVSSATGIGGGVTLQAGYFSTLTYNDVRLPGGQTWILNPGLQGGGSVSLNGANITVTGVGNAAIVVDGKGSSNGGFAYIDSVSGNLNIGSGSNQISVSANGGSAGSLAGNAGTITMRSGNNLIVNMAGISARPLGINGNGPSLNFSTVRYNAPSAGLFRITGDVIADGVGTGAPGTAGFSYYYSTPANYTITVGNTSTPNYISGKISAKPGDNWVPSSFFFSGGVGFGNSYSISSPCCTQFYAPIVLDVQSSITTVNATGQVSSFNLYAPGNPINVSTSGAGSITGSFGAQGSSVTFAANGPARLQSITASAGGITINAPSIAVPNGITISATGGNLVLNTTALSNFGLLTSTNQVQLTTRDFTNAGVVQSFGAGNSITVSSADNLNFAASGLFDQRNGGTTRWTAVNAINFADYSYQRIQGGTPLVVTAPSLNLSNLSQINASGPSAITVTSPGALNVVLTDGAYATIETRGGTISILPANGQPLNFTKAAGALTSTLNLLGGNVAISTLNNTMNVDANVTVASNSRVDVTVNGSTLTNNGVITTSANVLNVNGTSLAINGNGIFQTTGPAPILSVTGNTALTLGGAARFLAGPAGQVIFTSNLAAPTGAINIANLANILVNAGAVVFNTPVLNFADSSLLRVTSAASVLVRSGNSPLTISAPGGGAATFDTGTTPLMVQPGGAGGFSTPVTFTRTGAASNGTLNIAGDLVITTQGATAANVTIDPLVTIASTGNIAVSLPNGGTLTNNGALSANTLTFTTPAYNGSGAATANTGNVNIQSNGPGAALSMALGSGATVRSAVGAVNLNGTTAGAITVSGSGDFQAGTNVLLNGGSAAVDFVVNSVSGLIIGSGSTFRVQSSAGDITTGAAASTGSMDIAALGGNLTPQATLNPGTTLTLTSGAGANNRISVAAGLQLLGTTVTLRTPNLVLDGSATASSGPLSVSSTAAANALAVTMGSGSFLRSSTGSLSFNAASPGGVTINSGNGDLQAATNVTFNGGPGATSVNVNSLTGVATGTADTINLRVASGDLATGVLSATGGALVLTSNAGSITTSGAIDAATTINLTAAVDVTINANATAGGVLSASASGTIRTAGGATVSGVSISTTSPVLINDGILLSSNGGNSLQLGSTGSLSLSGAGTVRATGANAIITATVGNLGTLSLSGPLTFDAINTSGKVAFHATTGAILFSGAPVAIANGTSVDLNSSSVTFGALSGLVASGASPVSFQGSTGTLNVTVTGGTATVQTAGAAITFAPAAGQSMTLSKGPGNATLALTDGPVTFTTTGGASITVAGGLIVQANQSITVSGSNLINNGAINSAASFSMQDAAAVTISGTGSLTAPTLTVSSTNGSVTINQASLTGTLNGSGVGFSATASAGDVLAGAINALTGDLFLDAANIGGVVDGGNLQADRTITLIGRNGINIGAVGGAGVTFRSGVLAQGFGATQQILPTGSVLSDGAITINNYAGGAGTGDITIGDNVTLTSAGGANGASGNIAIVGSTDITTGNNFTASAWGGDIWLSAGDDLTIGNGSVISSMARLTGGVDRSIPAGSVADHTGGRIALYAGAPATNLGSLLNTMIDSRVAAGSTSWPSFPLYDSGANSSSVPHGGLMQVILPGAGIKSTILGNTFTADGGILLIDPPDPNNTVSLLGTTVLALAPVLVAGVVPPIGPVVLLVVPPAGTPGLPAPTDSKASVAVVVSPRIDNQPNVPTDRINQPVLISNNDARRACQINLNLPQVSTNDDEYVVVSNACQGFVIKSGDDAMAFGTAGSTIKSKSNGRLALSRGRLLVMSGKHSETEIDTDKGNVLLPVSSIAIVETTAAGVVRVTSLSGAPARLAPHEGAEPIIIRNGEESVIASVNNTDEELIPTDGVERFEVSAKITFGQTLVAKKNRVDREQMLRTVPTMECDYGCFRLPTKKKLENLKEAAAADEPLPRQQPTKSPLAPVGYQTSANRSNPLIELTNKFLSVLYTNGTVVTQTRADMVHLQKGQIVVSAEKPVVIALGEQHVSVRPGAIVFVEKEGQGVRVINLTDKNHGAVTFQTQHNKVPLTMGTQLLAHKDEKMLHALLDTSVPMRRTTVSYASGVASSEVSLVNLFNQYPVLAKMSGSRDGDRRRITKRIHKSMASLQVATASHGAYSKK